MKRIALFIVAALAALVVILAIVISLQPDEFAVERSATIEAPVGLVFGLVDDFRHWGDWAPWMKDNPEMETTFSGPETGEGATFAWAGYTEAGAGQMRVLKSEPNERIEIEMQFFEPFESTSTTAFSFRDTGAGATEVTWSMYGESTFLSKAIGLFFNMEELIGSDYERGLSMLDELAQATASAVADTKGDEIEGE